MHRPRRAGGGGARGVGVDARHRGGGGAGGGGEGGERGGGGGGGNPHFKIRLCPYIYSLPLSPQTFALRRGQRQSCTY